VTRHTPYIIIFVIIFFSHWNADVQTEALAGRRI
jgi:hypothetical protein